MRRKYELYINGTLADIDIDTLVLMNYKQTDASSPATVFNAWSQSVALPRTSKNNVIFDHIFRADHTTAVGKFNPLVRTPFVIYSDTGEILESGYLKLTDIDETQYTATLYGGLGGFLYGLMYNPDGSKRSLADLVYTPGGDEHEFDFKITRDAVREAWRNINGLEAHAIPWDYINFAPCYNGLPGGDFDSKRAFCPSVCYGVTNDDGNGHTDRNGHVLVDLVNNVDEWAANDLRSYQQRPVVSMKAVIDAICDAANNGGYTVNLDADFFKNSNPYYYKSWLTLPRFDELMLPAVNDSEPLDYNILYATSEVVYQKTLVHGNLGAGSKYKVWAKLSPVSRAEITLTGSYSMAKNYPNTYPYNTLYRNVVFFQLVCYDQAGNIIGGSKVSCITSKAVDHNIWPETKTTEELLTICTQGYGVYPAPFTPPYNPTGNLADIAGTEYVGDFVFSGSDTGTFDGGDVVLECEAMNVDRVDLVVCPVGIHDDNVMNTALGFGKITKIFDKVNSMEYENEYYFNEDANNRVEYQNGSTVRTGVQITKALLLGGTHTPADYLLSYLKTFGLYITYNAATKEVGIVTRKNFFNGGDVNLEGRIHLPSRKSIPYAIAARWYEWGAPVSGRYASYYRDIYNKDYGQARVNTGFEFDASHNDVLKDCVFRGAAEVLHRNKYFVHVTQYSRAVPAPFLDGGKFTLWDSSNEGKQYDVTCPDDSAAINYVNVDYPGYDYTQLPKPEFCDKDNKGVEGEDVLLFYDVSNGTAYYSRYTLTDDNELMTLYNDGAPCWLLGQWTIAANKKYTINNDPDASVKLYMPRFRRIMTGATFPMVATHSLDMAVPSEIDQPDITVASDKAVYPRGWADYVSDKMNVDTKVLTCKVDLRGFQVGQDLLRKFYYFGGSVWVLNAIKNHVVGGDNLTECEFIRVNDKTKYTNGQTY